MTVHKMYNVTLVVVTIAALNCGACLASDNPLLGTWKWDNQRTLHEFQMPTTGNAELIRSATKAKRFVNATVLRLRSNMTLMYLDKECIEVIHDALGRELSRKALPYRIIKLEKDYLLVDQYNNGGVGKIFRENDDSFYVEVKVGTFVYRDYFTRIGDSPGNTTTK